MIKCNVTICGTISRTAQMRTGKEGKPFMSLGVNVVIPAKSGINKTVEISVAKDGGSQEELANYPVGNRIEVVGTLTFHKKGDAFYLNLSATGINTFSAGLKTASRVISSFVVHSATRLRRRKTRRAIPSVFSQLSAARRMERTTITPGSVSFSLARTVRTGCSPRFVSVPKVNSRCLSITTALTSLAVSVRCLCGTRLPTIQTAKAYA